MFSIFSKCPREGDLIIYYYGEKEGRKRMGLRGEVALTLNNCNAEFYNTIKTLKAGDSTVFEASTDHGRISYGIDLYKIRRQSWYTTIVGKLRSIVNGKVSANKETSPLLNRNYQSHTPLHLM